MMELALFSSVCLGISASLLGWWVLSQKMMRLFPPGGGKEVGYDAWEGKNTMPAPFKEKSLAHGHLRRELVAELFIVALLFLLSFMRAKGSVLSFVSYCILGLLFWRLGQRWVRGCMARRKAWDIQAQWPLFLESMAVAALAGSDLVGAFRIAGRRTYGFFKEELERVIARVQGGMSLGAALAVFDDDKVQCVKRLRSTLIQAEMLGTPVADVLKALASEAYMLERQVLEERLNSLPVKLSFVTVVFLLPPVLVISVVPHILAFLGSRW